MKINSNLLVNFGLKALALVAFVYFTNQNFSQRLSYLISDQKYSILIVFTVLWVFSILVLFTVSFQQKAIYRIFWGAIIALTTAISYGFYAAGGSELEVLDVFELWQARHEAGRAVSYFMDATIKAGIVALIGFAIIAYPPPKLSNKTAKYLGYTAWLPVLPILIFCSLIYIKSDRAVAGLPKQFSPISMVMAIGYKSLMHTPQERGTVKSAPVKPPKAKHLVYLIDESVSPNYIYSRQDQYLKGFDDNLNKIADFGVAVSGSNCSARSNAILRLGATRDNLIQTVRTSPSIWQYAKKAGFKTVYIDAQASGIMATKPNDYQNYMTATEAQYIDKFYKVKDVESPQLDYKLLELIKKELLSDVPTFIYANKNGAHFPYAENYPESEAIYQPVVPNQNGLSGLMDSNSKSIGMQSVINAYKNSIHWTVDKFFQQFFDELDLDDTVVVYTSDHGQYFKEGSTTHCSSGEGAPAAEGLVPLMLMSSNDGLIAKFNEAATLNFNKSDHFSLFPTLLNLLGYSEDMQKSYGSTLFDEPNDRNAAFNTGDILGIISINTIWREVTQEERLENSLVTSPAKD